MEPSWHGFGAGTGPTQARNRATHRDAYLALRYSEGVTMCVTPQQEQRFDIGLVL